mgnify:CR=1 FL=1
MTNKRFAGPLGARRREREEFFSKKYLCPAKCLFVKAA